MNVLSIAAQGQALAARRFDASAQRVLRAGASQAKVDLAVEAVEQVAAVRSAQANLASLRAADAMSRRLLDIKA